MKNKHLKWGLAVFFFVLLLVGISIVIVPEIEHIKRDIEINRTLEEWKRLTIKKHIVVRSRRRYRSAKHIS